MRFSYSFIDFIGLERRPWSFLCFITCFIAYIFRNIRFSSIIRIHFEIFLEETVELNSSLFSYHDVEICGLTPAVIYFN